MFVVYEVETGWSDDSMRFATVGELSKFLSANDEVEYMYRMEK